MANRTGLTQVVALGSSVVVQQLCGGVEREPAVIAFTSLTHRSTFNISAEFRDDVFLNFYCVRKLCNITTVPTAENAGHLAHVPNHGYPSPNETVPIQTVVTVSVD